MFECTVCPLKLSAQKFLLSAAFVSIHVPVCFVYPKNACALDLASSDKYRSLVSQCIYIKARTRESYLSTMGICCIFLGDSMPRCSSLRVVAKASSSSSDIGAWIAIIVESVGIAIVFKKGSGEIPVLSPTLTWFLLPPATIVFIVQTT